MKIPAKQVFPTRSDFKRQFSRRLGALSSLMDPISELLAEEAEGYLYKRWFRCSKPTTIVTIESERQEGRIRHYCPSCGKRHIYPGYLYCPKCGAGVVWQKKIA